ncbi:hypothetical protein RCOM_0639010 [Ricinus communis]|uniref:RNase H type-1 domain-containing protein n=1 Tax=Ricinus communis TaxID=3988 RepID=B9T5W5_RICCO|nr:hypothetical protein RCOM_0639010 [Ricinus communis]
MGAVAGQWGFGIHHVDDWAYVFGVTIWKLWQWRNKEVFGGNGRARGWTAPLEQWVKVNSDGAFESTSGMVRAGGLIRDYVVDFLAGDFLLDYQRLFAPPSGLISWMQQDISGVAHFRNVAI